MINLRCMLLRLMCNLTGGGWCYPAFFEQIPLLQRVEILFTWGCLNWGSYWTSKVYKLYFIASCLKYVLCLCLNLLICDVVLCFAFSSIFMFGECGFNLLLISYILLAWCIIFCSIIYVVKFAWYLLYLDLLSGIFLVVTIVHRENFV